MATLTWDSGLPLDPMKINPTVKVNGKSVLRPYILKDGDVITVYADSHCVIVNNNSYLATTTISLSDVDIYVYGGGRTLSQQPVTVTINYSEGGGGGTKTLTVSYNSQTIINEEVTTPVTVTYNGSTIATLNEGDTKTLQCNGKVMSSDVVIGDKTLQCNGKLMASDVVVEVEGGATPTGETWVINEDIFDPTAGMTKLYPTPVPSPVPIPWSGEQVWAIQGISFSNSGVTYDSLAVTIDEEPYLHVIVQKLFFGYNLVVADMSGVTSWIDQAYRTITLDSPATGDFLTWLEANAVKQ